MAGSWMGWYALAAEQGSVGAQVSLGSMYSEGKGVVQDFAKALRYYRLAADQGSSAALFNLGIAYEFAEGVTQDYKAAASYYWKAYKAGDPDGMRYYVDLKKNGYIPEDFDPFTYVPAD